MRRILAIASISMRTAFRSKVFLTLTALLILIIVGIPLTLKGDGTTAGYVRIIIDYTLNFVRFILAVAAIWSGCASISQEVDTKQVQMTVTKPVHPLQIWIGKWLGIATPIFVLVLFSGVIVYGLLMYNLRPATLTDAEREALRRDILVSRSEILPEPSDDLDDVVEEMVADIIAHGEVQSDVSVHEIRRMARNHIITSRQTIAPEERFVWKFSLPPVPDDRSIGIEYRGSASSFGGTTLPVAWSIYDADGSRRHSEETVIVTENDNQINVPAKLLTGLDSFYLEFLNLSNEDTIFFPREDSVKLMAYAGGFELNLLRTVLVIALQLAFLAAIAVTMGAIFSTPVAAFVSVFLLLLVFMDGYIYDMSQQTDYSPQGHACAHGHAPHDCDEGHDAPRLFDRAIHTVFVSLNAVISPLREDNALELCATGRKVSWSMVGRTLFYRVVVYGGLIALAGAGIFKRRELALPQR